tara:strand:+ start:665 stop:1090 length:426 start_codon:yes stop_codon:yes gene_type:complete
MNKTELKKILKPLIKECIKEVIFEDGTLSTIISEVMKGTTGRQIVTEAKHTPRLENKQEATARVQRKQNHLKEQQRKMLDAIGKDAYNGVNLFEGTTPITPPRSQSSPQGSKALDGVAPSDPGVDISSFASSGVWKKLAGN